MEENKCKCSKYNFGVQGMTSIKCSICGGNFLGTIGDKVCDKCAKLNNVCCTCGKEK